MALELAGDPRVVYEFARGKDCTFLEGLNWSKKCINYQQIQIILASKNRRNFGNFTVRVVTFLLWSFARCCVLLNNINI